MKISVSLFLSLSLFPDASGSPAGYFSPDVKCFSDILNHDLDSISQRWLSNFNFKVESVAENSSSSRPISPSISPPISPPISPTTAGGYKYE